MCWMICLLLGLFSLRETPCARTPAVFSGGKGLYFFLPQETQGTPNRLNRCTISLQFCTFESAVLRQKCSAAISAADPFPSIK